MSPFTLLLLLALFAYDRCWSFQSNVEEHNYDEYYEEDEFDPKEQVSLLGGGSAATPKPRATNFRVPNFHFHLSNVKASVTLSRISLLLPEPPEFEKWENSGEQLRLETVSVYPKMILQGVYKIDRSKYFDDFDTAIKGQFKYITNFTSTCLGFLDESSNGLSVAGVDCDYHVAPIEVQFKRQKSNPLLENIATHDSFVWILQNKLWHDLSSILDDALLLEMDAKIRKKPARIVDGEEEERRKNETRDANNFVDKVISHARRIIQEKYGDRIKLPDIDDTFEQQLVLVPVRGRVVCKQGRVEGATSVSRVGDCKLASNVGGVEGNIHYYGILGFKELKIIYENYKVSVLGLGPSGTLTAKLYPVQIMTHIHADYNEGTVSLDKFKVVHVGDLVVDLTGSMVGLDWLLSIISSFLVNMVRDSVISDLEQRYADYIRDILSRYSLTDILMDNYPDLAA